MITLYEDQAELVQNVRNSFKAGNKSVLMQSATGSGKTQMAAYMVMQAMIKPAQGCIVFCVPRKALMEQTSETFNSHGMDHGLIGAGYTFNKYHKLYIATMQTLARRIESPDFPKMRMLVVDETHYGAAELDRIIKHAKAQGTWILGLSATPTKLSGQGLGCWYDDMVQGKSIRWLMDNKRLSDYRYFAPTILDLSALKVTAGDYSKGELNSFMEEKRQVIGDAVKYYKTHAMGNIHMVFGTSIKHSNMIAEEFRSQGITAAHVDGEMDRAELGKILRAYARREIKVITNCDLLTFGFDLSQASGLDVTIESISDLKPTMSVALQRQKDGRALRYKGGKPALFFGHANNAFIHGMPCEEIAWTLDDVKVSKRDVVKKMVTGKRCEKCHWLPPRPAPVCPNCGTPYEVQSREVEHVDGELVEMTKEQMQSKMDAMKKVKKDENKGAKTIEELIALGYTRGYKSPEGWAHKQMELRQSWKR